MNGRMWGPVALRGPWSEGPLLSPFAVHKKCKSRIPFWFEVEPVKQNGRLRFVKGLDVMLRVSLCPPVRGPPGPDH